MVDGSPDGFGRCPVQHYEVCLLNYHDDDDDDDDDELDTYMMMMMATTILCCIGVLVGISSLHRRLLSAPLSV